MNHRQQFAGLNGLSKATAARRVNQLLHSPGVFRDSDWQHVRAVFDKMAQAGVDYTLTSTKYDTREDGTPISKTWKFEVSFVNDKSKPTTLYGVLVAAGAGSVVDPLAAYDISAYVS